VCFSGKNKLTPWEYININPVICRFNCPLGPSAGPKSTGLWSNPAIWPSGSVPNGSEPLILIPSNLSIIIDVDTPALQTLVVDGTLSFATPNTTVKARRLLEGETDTEIVLKAKRIWIRNGTVNIGTPTAPYAGKGAIELEGNFGDDSLIIDPFIDASSKVLAVTGQLNIYVPFPATVWTRLGAFASVGDT
jgi:G8 domain